MKLREDPWDGQPFKIAKVYNAYCPVCKHLLGERVAGMVFEGHCAECRATFTFSPGKETPSSVLDQKKRKTCNCVTCLGRLSE